MLWDITRCNMPGCRQLVLLPSVTEAALVGEWCKLGTAAESWCELLEEQPALLLLTVGTSAAILTVRGLHTRGTG